MEVALVVQLVLRHYDLTLVTRTAGDQGKADMPSPAAATSTLARLEQLVGTWGGASAQLGLGISPQQCSSPGPSGRTAGGTVGGTGDGTAGNTAQQGWGNSGDPGRLLPACDLQRLVGIKVPLGPCMVVVGAQPQDIMDA